MSGIPAANVTTTGSIEGWSIDAYLGTVVAQSVTGAGLVTEFFAGFRDIFGGRSRALRARLGEIYREALEELRRQAAAMRANWIVGLRVDIDEVSGKGTMMFMVTATGTAVRAAERADGRTPSGGPLTITLEQLRVVEQKERLLALSDPAALDADDDNWKFIIQHRMVEAAPLVLAWARRTVPEDDYSGDDGRLRRIEKPMSFFEALSPSDATEQLYRHLAVPDVPAWTPELHILAGLNLMSLTKTADLLESGQAAHRWWGLQSLRAMQQTYVKADAVAIDRCISAIDSGLLVAAPAEQASRALGLGKKLVWHCLSRHTNEDKQGECFCGLTRFGLRKGDLTPEDARRSLVAIRRLLLGAFDGVSTLLTATDPSVQGKPTETR